jgi:4-aminobutyrate aminotransferase
VLEAGHTVVRISPPLVITAEEAALGLKLFGEAVAEAAAKA